MQHYPAKDLIAVIARKGDDSTDGALARIVPGKTVSTMVPGLGQIRGVADSVKEGDEVWLVGRTSGLVKGKVLAIESGKIITTRIASHRDGGLRC